MRRPVGPRGLLSLLLVALFLSDGDGGWWPFPGASAQETAVAPTDEPRAAVGVEGHGDRDHQPVVDVSTLFPAPRHCRPEDSSSMVICTIAILHYRKVETPIESFEVGFRAAVTQIEADFPYRFTWVNVALLEGVEATASSICDYLSAFDHYWVKSNWEWVVDSIARRALNHCPTSRSLLISGTFLPPSEEALHFYHALYYETHWYREFADLDRHPLAIHAFGIDEGIINREAQGIPDEVRAEWDYLVISKIAYNHSHKRTLKVLEKQGRRLLIGSSSGEQAQALGSVLRDHGVHIQQVVSYAELAKVIATTRTVYIPDDVFGGGERAVLEARAMNVSVEVEHDNPKLQELMHGPIYTHTYYARQLVHGIELLSARLQSLEHQQQPTTELPSGSIKGEEL